MKPKIQRFAASSAALFIVLAASPLASAATVTWDGGAGTGAWATGTNWTGTPDNTAPVAGDTLVFGGTTQPSTNNGLTADLSFAAINFTNDNSVGKTSAFTLAGNRITLGGNITTTVPTANGTILDQISLDMILSGSRTITTNATGSGASLKAHNLTISGLISESSAGFGLIKAGAGTLTLTNSNNSFTGNVSVGGGTGSVLSFNTIADKNVSSALGAGTTITVTASNSGLTYTGGLASSNRDFVLNNTKTLFSNTGGGLLTLSGGVSTSGTTGSLQLRSGNVELSGVFTGAGFASVNSSSSTLTLSNAANDFTNPLDIFSGTISVNSIADQGVASAAGKGTTINIAGGTNAGKLIYTGGASTNTRIIGLFGNSGTATIDQSGGAGLLKFTSDMTNPGSAAVANAKTFTLQGSTAGTGEFGGKIIDALAGSTTATSVTKAGTNTWTLSGANTYSGLTTVNVGVLQVANSAGLGSTAAGTVVNGSNGASNFFGTALDLNGVSIGSGESLILASGTTASNRVTLRTVGTTTNTWAGGVQLTGNKIVQFNANAGGQLEISGAVSHSSFTGSVTLRGAGTGILSGGVTLDSATAITVNDGGTWNVNTTSNTWGNTVLFNGTMALSANDALPTTTSLTVGGGSTSGALKLNGKSQTVAGLTTSGTGTANKVVNGSATAGALTLNNSTANAFAGVLGGTGTDENNFSLTKSGAGELTLSGASTYTGATLVSAGTLKLDATGTIDSTSEVSLGTVGTFDVSLKSGYTVATLKGSGNVTGSLTVSTQLAIGNSPGTTNFSSSLTLDSAAYVYEMTGSVAPSVGSADLGNVGGTLTITAGSVLDLVELGTYTLGNKFTLFGYGTLSGTFDGLANNANFLDDLSNTWQIKYDDASAGANGGTGTNFVTITAVPEPAAALLGGLGLLALLRRRR